MDIGEGLASTSGPQPDAPRAEEGWGGSSETPHQQLRGPGKAL